MLEKYFTETELKVIEELRNTAVERHSAKPKLHREEGNFLDRMFGVSRMFGAILARKEDPVMIFGRLKHPDISGDQSQKNAMLNAMIEGDIRPLIVFVLYFSDLIPVSERVEQAKRLLGHLQAIGLDIIPHTMRSDLVNGFERCCDKHIGYYRPDWQLRGASEYQYKLADETTTHIHYIKHESEGASLEDEDAVGEVVGYPLASYETNLGRQSLSRP